MDYQITAKLSNLAYSDGLISIPEVVTERHSILGLYLDLQYDIHAINGEVVAVIRGTEKDKWKDIWTDIRGLPVLTNGVLAHRSFCRAAKLIMQRHPEITFATGHSYGACVATIIALLDESIKAHAYAPAPCARKNGFQSNITTIIHGSDPVPRINPYKLYSHQGNIITFGEVKQSFYSLGSMLCHIKQIKEDAKFHSMDNYEELVA